MTTTLKNALRFYIKEAAQNLKTTKSLDDALFWEQELINARAELQNH
jgi:hypothetical protein